MDESQFQSMMEDVDEELRCEDMHIHARPIHAVNRVAKRLKIEIIMRPLPQSEITGCYDAITLAAHINRWYHTRYEDRLKVHQGPGSVAILIRGDPWRMRLPLIFGTVSVICDTDFEKYKNAPRMGTGREQLVYNVLNCVSSFPSKLASKLTVVERKEILSFFITNLSILQELGTIRDKPYVKEGLADLEAAVSHILSISKQYGLSKWSSLQFIEKLLKSFIELKGESVPRHHNLATIAQGAQEVGLNPINMHLVSQVQCAAGVRYGEIQVNLHEAMAAHHATLTLSQSLVDQISQA